ncbi:MAG: hypothetical protein ACRYGG_02470 [Janthinobacterium lividum]
MAIPGFLRGRRLNARTIGSPSLFTLYEVAHRGVSTSEAYLARLNNPTPWTRKMLAQSNYVSRTLCNVVTSLGRGTGSKTITVRFPTSPEPVANFVTGLCAYLTSEFSPRGTHLATHLLSRDTETERPISAENGIRTRTDNYDDVIVVLEGTDLAVLRSLVTDRLSTEFLNRYELPKNALIDEYELAHLLSHQELSETA